ncbi:hypothetical protein GCM10023195_69330 [Actinoallomurus liliacearum]|uniref:Uncharacterized protein n=1 Tax=Actinoallomurus liliacearum TaxID=1080073 RepID=A0ABP8TW76_9ACTN
MNDPAWKIRPFAGISGFGVEVDFGARRDEVTAAFAERFGDDLGTVRPFRKASWDVGSATSTSRATSSSSTTTTIGCTTSSSAPARRSASTGSRSPAARTTTSWRS